MGSKLPTVNSIDCDRPICTDRRSGNMKSVENPSFVQSPDQISARLETSEVYLDHCCQVISCSKLLVSWGGSFILSKVGCCFIRPVYTEEPELPTRNVNGLGLEDESIRRKGSSTKQKR